MEKSDVLPLVTEVRLKQMLYDLLDLNYKYGASIPEVTLVVETGYRTDDGGVAETVTLTGTVSARRADLAGTVTRNGEAYPVRFSPARGFSVDLPLEPPA